MATKSFTGGIVDFISWWYRNIPLWILRLFKRVALICDDSFSISLLIRTFFVPWHRDYSITGRIVGIIVRLVYLPIVLFITAILLSIVLVFLIIWTTLPIIFIYTIVNTIQN
jgi:hypothetical protein